MGYTTQFKGTLKFKNELTLSQLGFLNSMLDEDCRKHPEWEAPGLFYIDLKLTDDFSGLEWNGAEKTYDMHQLVNVVIKEMKKKYPDFELTGHLIAQGEDIEDIWKLNIKNGKAVREEILLDGEVIECPECNAKFRYN